MEKDGQFHYSAVRRILINKTTSPFTIHPNPVINKECTVRFGYLQQQPCSLSLVDDKGAIVASFDVPAGVMHYALKLPANLPGGMYIVSIGTTYGAQQQKILVQ